ncbi:MAG: hypothetical protein RLZZ272_129 [Actinomycetota bacterium]
MSAPADPHRAELALGARTDSERRGLAAPSLGRLGEDLAAAHLTEVDGLEVVARNWRVRCEDLVGELDLVARDGDGTLVVVEVKTRRGAGRFGGALAAAGARKGRRVRRLAGAFVSEGGWRAAAVRLDLVAIDVVGHRARLEHVMDAW